MFSPISVFLYVRHKLHAQLRPIFLLQQSFLFYRQHDVIVPHIVFSKKAHKKESTAEICSQFQRCFFVIHVFQRFNYPLT